MDGFLDTIAMRQKIKALRHISGKKILNSLGYTKVQDSGLEQFEHMCRQNKLCQIIGAHSLTSVTHRRQSINKGFNSIQTVTYRSDYKKAMHLFLAKVVFLILWTT